MTLVVEYNLLIWVRNIAEPTLINYFTLIGSICWCWLLGLVCCVPILGCLIGNLSNSSTLSVQILVNSTWHHGLKHLCFFLVFCLVRLILNLICIHWLVMYLSNIIHSVLRYLSWRHLIIKQWLILSNVRSCSL